jgi:hypothetical protein
VNCPVLCVRVDWKYSPKACAIALSKLRSLLYLSVRYDITQYSRSFCKVWTPIERIFLLIKYKIMSYLLSFCALCSDVLFPRHQTAPPSSSNNECLNHHFRLNHFQYVSAYHRFFDFVSFKTPVGFRCQWLIILSQHVTFFHFTFNDIVTLLIKEHAPITPWITQFLHFVIKNLRTITRHIRSKYYLLA